MYAGWHEYSHEYTRNEWTDKGSGVGVAPHALAGAQWALDLNVDFSYICRFGGGPFVTGEVFGWLFAGFFGLLFAWAPGQTLFRYSMAALRSLPERTRRLRLDRVPPVHSSHQFQDGGFVRVVGEVQAIELGWSALGGKPAVAWSSTLDLSAGERISHLVGAEDFIVQLPDGERILIRARSASDDGNFQLSIARARRWQAQLLQTAGPATMGEMLLRPGDQVEVFGVLGRATDCRGRADSPRGVPTLWTLSHAPGRPLVARDPAPDLLALETVPATPT